MFYVYCILDPRKPGYYKYDELEFNFEPFYVGKASKRRLKNTLQYKKRRNTIKNNKLKAIKKSGLQPNLIILYDNLDELSAFNLEKSSIKKIGRIIDKKGPLGNLTEGGDGTTGYKHTDLARKKISETHRGIVKSKEWIEKLIKSHKGYKTTDKTKKKLSEINSVPKPYLRNRYLLISPDGFKYSTDYLENFCSEHGISYNSMLISARNNKKIKNWKCIKLNNNYEL